MMNKKSESKGTYVVKTNFISCKDSVVMKIPFLSFNVFISHFYILAFFRNNILWNSYTFFSFVHCTHFFATTKKNKIKKIKGKKENEKKIIFSHHYINIKKKKKEKKAQQWGESKKFGIQGRVFVITIEDINCQLFRSIFRWLSLTLIRC